jgi:hypothetical protein
MRRTIGLLALLAGLGVVTSPALALHNQPFKGKNFKINLMTAYAPCTSPNAMTDDGLDACVPVRSDPSCGFGGGQGKVQLKALTIGNTSFRIKINGLDQFCEGQVLQFYISYRKTGHHCGGNSCTTVDVVNHPLGSCSTHNSVCKTSGAIFLPGGAQAGQVEILNVHAEHNGVPAFTTGLITVRP